MNEDVKRDLGNSAASFLSIVYPKLVELGFVHSKALPVEAVTSGEMAKALDIEAGIDTWLIQSGKGIIGLASRVQQVSKEKWVKVKREWSTFTIREKRTTGAKTEYKKRLDAIESKGKYLYPYITCQAYVTGWRNGELLAVGLAKTRDIFATILKGYMTRRINPDDGNSFVVVSWSDIKRLKYPINTWAV